MTRVRLRDPCIPPSLTGWVLVDDQGLPRYWATVWAALHGAALQESTLSAHLSVIESFYRSVKLQLNEDCLDRLIADLCFDKLERCLEGFLSACAIAVHKMAQIILVIGALPLLSSETVLNGLLVAAQQHH